MLTEEQKQNRDKSQLALVAIRQAGFELLDHPLYSPDLALSDYYLFPKLKENIRGKKFNGDDEMMDAENQWFLELPGDFFLNGLKLLERRWAKCVEVAGDYVEK